MRLSAIKPAAAQYLTDRPPSGAVISISPFPLQRFLQGTLKALAPGQVSGVIRLERGEALVRLMERKEFDWEQYAAVRESEHQMLLTRRLNSIWNDWLADLKKQARIIDNRHVFF